MFQDTTADGVWASWMAGWRDVIIVDEDGTAVYSFNLTEDTLDDADNQAELKSILIAVAEGTPLPPLQ
jgi:hypothetical protein